MRRGEAPRRVFGGAKRQASEKRTAKTVEANGAVKHRQKWILTRRTRMAYMVQVVVFGNGSPTAGTKLTRGLRGMEAAGANPTAERTLSAAVPGATIPVIYTQRAVSSMTPMYAIY